MGQYGLGYNGTSGTEPEDLQQVIYSEYLNADASPILIGGEVTGRADLKYDYPAGVGLRRTAAGAIYVTWPAGTTALVTTPAVERVDTIYADETGVKVATGAPPANVPILGKRRLAAGATSTAASTSAWNRRWALGRDGTLGWLGTHGEVHAHGTDVPTARSTVVTIPFWVPNDRTVDIVVQQAIFSLVGSGDDRGTMQVYAYVDNILNSSWEAGYDGRWVPSDHTIYNVPINYGTDGQHSLRIERRHAWGAAPKFFGGGVDKLSSGFIGIIDRGAAE